MSAVVARLFVLLQYLLPRHLLTSLVHRLARVRLVAVKNLMIRNFVKFFRVDTSEVAVPVPDGFADFNAFFTRELRAGARVVDGDDVSIVSPVDGTVSAAGAIVDAMIFQAKQRRYSLQDLLAADLQDVELYRAGQFATIYLAPHNYHRVHAPLAGELRIARYVPGDLFSVNEKTVSRIPNLFARNERLICHIDADFGAYVLILVGALNVGSISTPWTGEIRPRRSGVVVDCELDDSEVPLRLAKGDLLGWFNMGSTVILLLPGDAAALSADLAAESTLCMGQAIGRLTASGSA